VTEAELDQLYTRAETHRDAFAIEALCNEVRRLRAWVTQQQDARIADEKATVLRWTTVPPGQEHEGRLFWVRPRLPYGPEARIGLFCSHDRMEFDGIRWAMREITAWAGPIPEPQEGP
jgi:hypothetical protein